MMQKQLNSNPPSSILRCIDLKLEAIDLAGSICHLLANRKHDPMQSSVFQLSKSTCHNRPRNLSSIQTNLKRKEVVFIKIIERDRKKCAKSLSNMSCFVTLDSFTRISEVFLANASHVLSDCAEDDSHWTQLLWYFRELRL